MVVGKYSPMTRQTIHEAGFMSAKHDFTNRIQQAYDLAIAKLPTFPQSWGLRVCRQENRRLKEAGLPTCHLFRR